MTIYDRFREFKQLTKHDGTYGIEIETETKKAYEPPKFFYWKSVPDNSLRDYGIEYIMKSPLSHKDVSLALTEFGDKTKDIKFITDSNSTSVHVHMNMLNETFLTLANIFTTYTLVENLLIRLSGPSRKSNLFCLPICDAEQTYKDMISMLTSVERNRVSDIWGNFGEEGNKYAAFNLAALGKQGSVEFRSFRGDPSPVAIAEWVLVLNSLLSFCQNPNLTPSVVIEKYRNNSEKLLKEVFGTTLTTIETACLASGDSIDKLLNKNFWYAASIAYSVKEWGKLDRTPENKKFKSMKALDAFCLSSYGKAYKDLGVDGQFAARTMFRQNGGMLVEVQQLGDFGADVWNNFAPAQAAAQLVGNAMPPMAFDEVVDFGEDD